MTQLVSARGLSKSYGNFKALDSVDFSIDEGRIVGLIGPNGAGKTTALKAILGLTHFDGELEVLGLDPRSQRHEVMQQVCFIADVAVLPRWMRVHQSLSLLETVHPRFDRAKAVDFLARTDVRMQSKISALSKGMVTQLHLALVMAIDAKLLVLDEPTLGLDILFRKEFYRALLNDYFDGKRTILITTHQVEEIEHLLTDLMFVNHGHLVLDTPMDELEARYTEVSAHPEKADALRQLGPLDEQQSFGRTVMLFEDRPRESLIEFGELRTPSITDLFVAKMKVSRK